MRNHVGLPALALSGFFLAAVPVNEHGSKMLEQCPADGTYTVRVQIKEPKELRDMYHSLGGTDSDFSPTLGFTARLRDGTVLVVVPPVRGGKDHKRMIVWGHELAHVVCGAFHK